MFLSTPPSRVATVLFHCGSFLFRVSIHATLAGGDLFHVCTSLVVNESFYPRHPRGWRLRRRAKRRLRLHVSIHATLAGGDCAAVSKPTAKPSVSIHATLASGDANTAPADQPEQKFLSTPPSRVATALRACPGASPRVSIPATLAGGDGNIGGRSAFRLLFLSTPPSRVATSPRSA